MAVHIKVLFPVLSVVLTAAATGPLGCDCLACPTSGLSEAALSPVGAHAHNTCLIHIKAGGGLLVILSHD